MPSLSYLLSIPWALHFACVPFLEIPVPWETSRSSEARRPVLLLFLSRKCKAIAIQPALLLTTVPFFLTDKQLNSSFVHHSSPIHRIIWPGACITDSSV